VNYPARSATRHQISRTSFPESLMLSGVRRFHVARTAAFVSAVAFAVIATPSQAMRHLKLLRSSPAADTVLTTSPDAIRLWLSEPAEAPASKIQLTTSAGAKVAIGAVSRDAAKDAPLVAKITTPLAAGAYTVTWKAMSKDGHVVNGTFGFRVGTAK
jgi:copper resistance protein C